MDDKTINRITFQSDINILSTSQDLEIQEDYMNQKVPRIATFQKQEDTTKSTKSRSPGRPGFPNTTSRYSTEVAAGFSPHSCHAKNCVGLDCKPIQSKRKADFRTEGQQAIARISNIQKRIANLEALLAQKNDDLIALQIKSRALDQTLEEKSKLVGDLE